MVVFQLCLESSSAPPSLFILFIYLFYFTFFLHATDLVSVTDAWAWGLMAALRGLPERYSI